MPNKLNIWFFFRLIIGCVFIVSGFEKIITPYQNFLYVIESYEILSTKPATFVAQTFPWIELLTGIFLILGLWLRESLIASSMMFLIFIGIVTQALIRQLPIGECGCFGELISLPLKGVLTMDICLLAATFLSLKKLKKTQFLSLDRLFLEDKS